jgi:hypothetical protein
MPSPDFCALGRTLPLLLNTIINVYLELPYQTDDDQEKEMVSVDVELHQKTRKVSSTVQHLPMEFNRHIHPINVGGDARRGDHNSTNAAKMQPK